MLLLTRTIIVNISAQFSRSVVSDSLWPHELQHARPPCPSLAPGVHPNPCPLSRWCHPVNSYQMPTLGLYSDPRAADILWGRPGKKTEAQRGHLPKGVWLGCAELESNSCLSAPKMWLFPSRPPCSPPPSSASVSLGASSPLPSWMNLCNSY